MRKSLDADVSAHLVKPVKISLLEQAIGFAFNLDRIRASPEATPGEHARNGPAGSFQDTHGSIRPRKGVLGIGSIPALRFLVRCGIFPQSDEDRLKCMVSAVLKA
jgi:hypothetical protein